MPPRVLASGPKPCGGNYIVLLIAFLGQQELLTPKRSIGKCYNNELNLVEKKKIWQK